MIAPKLTLPMFGNGSIPRKLRVVSQARDGPFPGGVRIRLVPEILLALVLCGSAGWTAPASPAGTVPARMLSKQGIVEFSPSVQTNWLAATNAQNLFVRDRLRTHTASHAAVQMADWSVLRLNQRSLLTILPPRDPRALVKYDFEIGQFYFLHRNEPSQIEVETRAVVAAIKGTEFHLDVAGDGRTVLTLIDGAVTLSNPFGEVTLQSGDQGIAEVNQQPIRIPRIQTTNVIQWCLYYPAVLDIDELDLPGMRDVARGGAVSPSSAAWIQVGELYRQGDLEAAAARARAIPPDRPAGYTDDQRIFLAGLELATGQVTNYAAFASGLSMTNRLANGLRWLAAAVQLETNLNLPRPTSGSEWLGYSYFLQSRLRWQESREAAATATLLSPNSPFAWQRHAEMEFNDGRRRQARRAIERALRLAPAHPQSRALEGFLYLAREDVDRALAAFEEAIRIEPRLGNGWLGRGLCRLRRGDLEGGRTDIQMAVLMEPTRWAFRSYLSKAYSYSAVRAGRAERGHLLTLAREEVALAMRSDPNDPLAWFYSGLLNYQMNQNWDAIADLEQAVELNDNRRLIHGPRLADQHLGVQRANLARVYERAGLAEVGLREAARAVNSDYTSADAHQFLSDSFNRFRDPRRARLREETAWANERLLANLLMPAGGGTLSTHVAELEYSSQFRPPPFGFLSASTVRSDGQFQQLASHFGRVDGLDYSLDLEYFVDDGDHDNTDAERLELYTQLKQHLTPDDALFLMTKVADFSGGDIIQRFDPAQARPELEFTERQTPLLFAGYQHRWGPGHQTIFLGGWLANDFRYEDRAVPNLVLTKTGAGDVVLAEDAVLYDAEYRSRFGIFSGELQQILEAGRHTFIVGVRAQGGEFRTRNELSNADVYQPGVPFVYPSSGDQSADQQRFTAYAYDIWRVFDPLWLTLGVAYDYLVYPENHRSLPVSSGEEHADQLSPKVALQYIPNSKLHLRAAYARSLGGASFEDSVRLEPSQLAGFSQAFRSIIPESVVGGVSGASTELWGIGLDYHFRPSSYVTVQAEMLHSEVDRQRGVFVVQPPPPFPIMAGETPETLRYREESLWVTFHQRFGPRWFGAAGYRYTHAQLDRRLDEIPASVGYAAARREEESHLHQFRLDLRYEQRNGFFAQAEALWFIQNNEGYSPARPSESVPQLNLLCGWRLWDQKLEAALGVVNITGEDYRLNPLIPYPNLPRDRAVLARLRINF